MLEQVFAARAVRIDEVPQQRKRDAFSKEAHRHAVDLFGGGQIGKFSHA